MTLTTYADLEQRSEEWFEARRGIVTASIVDTLVAPRTLTALDYKCPACDAPVLFMCRSKRDASAAIKTPHPERVAHAAAQNESVLEPADNDKSRGITATLVAERITGHADASSYMSDDMWRGVVEEPRAVERYAETTKANVETCGFMTEDKWGFKIGYSPDALVDEDGLLEVKAPRAKTQILTVISGEVPSYHMAQVQTGLLVSGRKWLDYIPWFGGLPLWTKRIYPDPKWQAAIVAAVAKFEENAAEMTAAYKQATTGLPKTERLEQELGLVF